MTNGKNTTPGFIPCPLCKDNEVPGFVDDKRCRICWGRGEVDENNPAARDFIDAARAAEPVKDRAGAPSDARP